MALLITGATGFIGARLIAAACEAFGQSEVVAFSSRPSPVCRTIVYGNGQGFDLSPADLALLDTVDVMIHAGAYTPKSGAEANALEGCNGNIHFTEKLLALPLNGLKKLLYLSSLDVYAPADVTDEATPTIPATLYGQSKLYCEMMVSVYAQARNVDCHILRIGHVYGPGEEKYAKFLPRAIKDILCHGRIELWGDGSEIRSFIYIDDVIAAILAASTQGAEHGVTNIVGGVPISIRALVDQLIAVSARPVEIVIREYTGAKRNYIFDNSKMRRQLLAVETDLAAGLRAEFEHMASLP